MRMPILLSESKSQTTAHGWYMIRPDVPEQTSFWLSQKHVQGRCETSRPVPGFLLLPVPLPVPTCRKVTLTLWKSKIHGQQNSTGPNKLNSSKLNHSNPGSQYLRGLIILLTVVLLFVPGLLAKKMFNRHWQFLLFCMMYIGVCLKVG